MRDSGHNNYGFSFTPDDEPNAQTEWTCVECGEEMKEVLRQNDWEWICDNEDCETNCVCEECVPPTKETWAQKFRRWMYE